MENWTQKWIRPNMVLNISHFGLELGYLRREKRRGEEEKVRREEEKKRRREEEGVGHGALKACNLYCFMKTIFYI